MLINVISVYYQKDVPIYAFTFIDKIGDSPFSLHQQFLIGRSTVFPIIKDTCQAIYKALQPVYLKVYCLYYFVNYKKMVYVYMCSKINQFILL